MGRPVNRIPLVGKPQAYETYSVRTIPGVHTRVGSCAETGCEHYRNGWDSLIDTSTDIGPAQKNAVEHSGRRYTHQQLGPTVHLYTFPPGQPCFNADQHTITTGREPLYLNHTGTATQPVDQPRRYDRADQWVDDFATHQDNLADELGN